IQMSRSSGIFVCLFVPERKSPGGKSTVIALLQKSFDPDHVRSVLRSREPPAEMGKAENLAGQRRIGFVLYPISANISYGKGDASETNIADKLSNAHGFIRGHQQ
ncbi:LOW QUALITY PROTEIN: hypothetical protein HID58_060028, partial [Brassica napus]